MADRKVHANENDVSFLYHANEAYKNNLRYQRWDALNKHLSPAKIERLKKLGWVEWITEEKSEGELKWNSYELKITDAGLEAIKDLAAIEKAKAEEWQLRDQLFREAKQAAEDSIKSHLVASGIEVKYVRVYDANHAKDISVELPLHFTVDYRREVNGYVARINKMGSEATTQQIIKEAQDAELVVTFLNSLVEAENKAKLNQ